MAWGVFVGEYQLDFSLIACFHIWYWEANMWFNGSGRSDCWLHPQCVWRTGRRHQCLPAGYFLCWIDGYSCDHSVRSGAYQGGSTHQKDGVMLEACVGLLYIESISSRPWLGHAILHCSTYIKSLEPNRFHVNISLDVLVTL